VLTCSGRYAQTAGNGRKQAATLGLLGLVLTAVSIAILSLV
jgi:hypothetical protein